MDNFNAQELIHKLPRFLLLFLSFFHQFHGSFVYLFRTLNLQLVANLAPAVELRGVTWLVTWLRHRSCDTRIKICTRHMSRGQNRRYTHDLSHEQRRTNSKVTRLITRAKAHPLKSHMTGHMTHPRLLGRVQCLMHTLQSIDVTLGSLEHKLPVLLATWYTNSLEERKKWAK